MKTKTLSIYLLILIVITVSSCQCDKDFKTTLSVKAKGGLSFEKTYISNGTEELKNNKIPDGTDCYIHVEGAKGFTESNGMVFIGCYLHITDKDDKTVLEYDDLLAEYDSTGISLEDSKYLSAHVSVGDPMVTGEDYDFSLRFWDKKGVGEINANMTIEVE